MTKDNAQKTIIRNRMKRTGESYAVAMRKLQPPKFEVIELGEDGECWFVVGTLDEKEAITAIKQWIDNIIWPDPGTPAGYDHPDENYLAYVAGDDFYFVPAYPDNPDSEYELKKVSKNPSEYKDEELFSGMLVQV